MGQRSYIRLVSLDHSIEKLSSRHDRLHAERTAVESMVMKLRPGSIDPDFLDERARYVLGYIHPDDYMLLRSN